MKRAQWRGRDLLSQLFNPWEPVSWSNSGSDDKAISPLTPRELQVLKLLAGGLTNKEIAQQMSYTVGTVKNVVQRIIEKLAVSDHTQAAVYAVRVGVDVA